MQYKGFREIWRKPLRVLGWSNNGTNYPEAMGNPLHQGAWEEDKRRPCQKSQLQTWSYLCISSSIPHCISIILYEHLFLKTRFLLPIGDTSLLPPFIATVPKVLTINYKMKSEKHRNEKMCFPTCSYSLSFNNINHLYSFNSKKLQVSLKPDLIPLHKYLCIYFVFISHQSQRSHSSSELKALC